MVLISQGVAEDLLKKVTNMSQLMTAAIPQTEEVLLYPINSHSTAIKI